MNTPAGHQNTFRLTPFQSVACAGAVIVLLGVAAYSNSFCGAFIYDDVKSIPGNASLRHLWPVWRALAPPPDATVSGRPVLNFSLAIDYAISARRFWSYHATNLLIHLLAGLTLFGVVRRTLLQPRLREKLGAAALPLALAVAVLWTVHPLQTESVTYIVQRAESLMGLFYLLTLYAFIRGTESRPGWWFTCAVMACLLGMATKEVMVSVPLIALLYDRTFVAGTFRAAWQKRKWVYAGLAATWILLGVLVAGTGGDRSGKVGFGVGIDCMGYWLTQFGAITRYLWLSVWPHPLALDYGTYFIRDVLSVVPAALIVVPLIVGTVLALWLRPVWGFLGMFFFSILAPTSLLPGALQMTVEHRMYLPLAVVLAVLVTGVYRLTGRRSVLVLLALAPVLVLRTVWRNEDYRTDLRIWHDTVAVRPESARARFGLGCALQQAGLLPEAIGQYEAALKIKSDYVEAENNLGNALAQSGRLDEAVGRYQAVLRLKPDHALAHSNLGSVFFQLGRLPEAEAQFRQAVRLKPDYADAHFNLTNVLMRTGRVTEAIGQYETVLRLQPENARAHYFLGNALYQTGRQSDAMAQWRQARRLDPHSPDPSEALAQAEADQPPAGQPH